MTGARVPRRWQRRITVAVIVAAVVLLGRDAFAAPSPQARVHAAMTATAARPFALNCTYAARDGAPAIAYPDAPAVVYAKPWVCGQARSFARHPTVAAARALLILTHEALHIRRWPGARDETLTECRALDEVDDFAAMLGARAALAAQVRVAAHEAHAQMGWGVCA